MDAAKQRFFYQVVPSPAGYLGVIGTEHTLVEIQLHTTDAAARLQILEHYPAAQEKPTALLALARSQLLDYFAGRRVDFSLPLDWSVLSEFRRRVLRHLYNLPFAAVTTYGELAQQLGRPSAARAVGAALAANPFVIVVPCHRVVGRGGRMTGYSGGAGIPSKEWLLDFERNAAQNLHQNPHH